MRAKAFLNSNDEDKLYDITYYHNPKHWIENKLGDDNPIADEKKWSKEIKYYEGDAISDDIKNLPTDKGGVYMFYLKGINLSFFENYIVYIGRCHYSEGTQHIRKRAKEYDSDNSRTEIVRMKKYWKDYLFYRYYPETDNDIIDRDEVTLIRAIRPPFNSEIPDKIEVQTTTNAF
ncbi:MAG: hypothetical protein J6T87_11920 [Bacteroidales bacterium]|nr:hypothetical protein [Bacteroidales bacterium]